MCTAEIAWGNAAEPLPRFAELRFLLQSWHGYRWRKWSIRSVAVGIWIGALIRAAAEAHARSYEKAGRVGRRGTKGELLIDDPIPADWEAYIALCVK